MADGIRVMSAEERRAWALNHPSPPLHVYVDVPGVPGNAEFARAREAADRRERPAAPRLTLPGFDGAYAPGAFRAHFEAITGRSLEDDPSMPHPAARDPEPYRAWMRTQSPERKAAFASIEQEAATIRKRGDGDVRYDCAPLPAPGQVWALPAGSVPTEWLAPDGTLTVAVGPDDHGYVRIAGSPEGTEWRASVFSMREEGWTCLGVVTAHGRVMVGDGFRIGPRPDEPSYEVIGVASTVGSVIIRGPDGDGPWSAAALARGAAGWTRTRYAPARPGERYRWRKGSRVVTVSLTSHQDALFIGDADGGVIHAFGHSVSVADWERLDALPGPHVEQVSVTLGDREHAVPVRPGESPEGATERFLASKLEGGDPKADSGITPAPFGDGVVPPGPRWHSDDPGGLPVPTPPAHADALSRPDPVPAPPDPEEAARRFFQGEGERSAPRGLTGWAEARHPWQMRGR